MNKLILLAALAATLFASTDAQTAPSAASITVNDLRAGTAPTQMVFSVTATAKIDHGSATGTVTFIADKSILAISNWDNGAITTTGLTGTSCTVSAASSTDSETGNTIVFTLAAVSGCSLEATHTATFTIATNIALNPSAGVVTATAATSADTNTVDATVYTTAAAAAFTVTNDLISLADQRKVESGVVTVQFNAGALKNTDTVAIVLPSFSGASPADATSVCGDAQPTFATSLSGASYTVTATLGANFNSAASGGALCVLKFSGVTNPTAVASPAYTIKLTDVAGNQVKTTAAAAITTKTAAAIVPADATFSANPADSSGTITATTAVTLASTGSAHVCYTTDGTIVPECDGAACATNKGTKFATAYSVTATKTIKAIGCGGAGKGDSDVSEKVYTWTAANPTVSPAAGNVAKDSAVTLTSAGSANICYTWTGTAPACKTDGTCETNSTAYNATAKPTVSATKTLKAIGCAGTGKTDSAVVTAAYTVNTTTTAAATTAAPTATTTVSGASSEAAWSTMLTVFAIAMAAFSTL